MAARLNFTSDRIARLPATGKRYRAFDARTPGLYVLVGAEGHKSFYLRYHTDGGRRARDYRIARFGDYTVEQARAEAVTLRAGILANIDPQTVKLERRAAAQRRRLSTLRGFFENDYLAHIATRAKTGARIVSTMQSNFKDWLDLPIETITRVRIEQWQNRQRNRGLKASSINRPLQYLRAALTRAQGQGLIKRNPFDEFKDPGALRRSWRLKEPKVHRTRSLSSEEETQLRAALASREHRRRQERVRMNHWLGSRSRPPLPLWRSIEFTDHLMPIVLLDIDTGMRRGEIFNLRWRNFDFQNRTVEVEAHTAKSSASRKIPLNAEALDVVERWRGDRTPKADEYVFANPKSGRRRDNITKAWTALVKAAQIEDFHFHDIRHTFISNLLARNVAPRVVMELAGHADLATTMLYAHVVGENAAALAVETLVAAIKPPTVEPAADAKRSKKVARARR